MHTVFVAVGCWQVAINFYMQKQPYRYSTYKLRVLSHEFLHVVIVPTRGSRIAVMAAQQFTMPAPGVELFSTSTGELPTTGQHMAI